MTINELISNGRSRPRESTLENVRTSTVRVVALLCVLGIAATSTPTRAAAVVRIWSGASNNLWSNADNWDTGVPIAGDEVVFPAIAANYSNINDLPPGLSLTSLTFQTNGYTLSGNAIAITAGVANNINFGTNIINMDLDLSTAGQIQFTGINASLNLNGNLTLGAGGVLLASRVNVFGVVSGPGGVDILGTNPVVKMTGNNIYTGATTIGAPVQIDGNQPASDVSLNSGILGGVGRVGDLITGAATVDPGPSFGAFVGIFTANDLELGANSLLRLNLQGPTAGIGHDRLDVYGTVTIDPTARPQFGAGSYLPALGQTFTIVNNDGDDPINGTFKDLPEGATLTSFAVTVRISYVGNTGNDITFTAITGDSTNEAPIAQDDAYDAPANGVLNVAAPGPLTNDSDPDDDDLLVFDSDTTSDMGGTVAVQVDGAFTYEPPLGYLGQDSFRYTVADTFGATADAIVFLNVSVPPTATPTPTTTSTPTPTHTATSTPTPTPTASPSSTPTPTATATPTISCLDEPLGGAGIHDLFALEALRLGQSNIAGSLVGGGDVDLVAVDVGMAIASLEDVIIAGQDLKLRNSSVYGNAVYGGAEQIKHTVFGNGGQPLQGMPINFEEVAQSLDDLRWLLSASPSNGDVLFDDTVLHLVGTDGETNVFHVAAAQLNATPMVFVEAPSTSTVLIVVDGTDDITLKRTLFDFGSVSPERVLLSFTAANKVSIDKTDLAGTILAVNSELKFSDTTFLGSVIAASIDGSGSTFTSPFEGCIEPFLEGGPPPVDEPPCTPKGHGRGKGWPQHCGQ